MKELTNEEKREIKKSVRTLEFNNLELVNSQKRLERVQTSITEKEEAISTAKTSIEELTGCSFDDIVETKTITTERKDADGNVLSSKTTTRYSLKYPKTIVPVEEEATTEETATTEEA